MSQHITTTDMHLTAAIVEYDDHIEVRVNPVGTHAGATRVLVSLPIRDIDLRDGRLDDACAEAGSELSDRLRRAMRI